MGYLLVSGTRLNKQKLTIAQDHIRTIVTPVDSPNKLTFESRSLH